MKTVNLAISLVFLSACTLFAQSPGSLDAAFGTGGKVITGFTAGQDDEPFSIAIQPDGYIVAAGATFNGSNADIALARYTPSGALDAAFGTGGKVTTNFSSGSDEIAIKTLLLPDGSILVAGYTSAASGADFALVKYNSTGALDAAFGSGGKVSTDFSGNDDYAYTMAVQPDGKIILAGLTDDGNSTQFALARYLSTGAIDNTFGTAGKVVTAFSGDASISNMLLKSTGEIVVVGSAQNANFDFALAQYNSSGALDASFGVGGKFMFDFASGDDYGNAIYITSSGKFIVAGSSDNPSDGDFALALVNPNGTLDAAFGTGGKVVTDFIPGNDDAITSLAIQSDGYIIAGGWSDIPSTSSGSFAIARYNPSGALDAAFGTGGKVITSFGTKYDYINDIKLLSNGQLLAAGSTEGATNYDFALAKYHCAATTTLKDFEARNKIVSVYPNPVIDKFFLEMETENPPLSFSITDIYGKELYTFSGKEYTLINDGKMEFIFPSQLEKGVYFLCIQTEKGRLIHKISRQ